MSQKKKSQRGVESHWRLRYKDFLPDSKAWDKKKQPETFQSLVNAANKWLGKNSDVAVRSCETVTWTGSDPDSLDEASSGETMVIGKTLGEEDQTFSLTGLRLWLVPRSERRGLAQILSHIDLLPDDTRPSMPHLVKYANKKLEDCNVKGRVISVQTWVALVEDGVIKHGDTSWVTSNCNDVRQTFFLRLFFVRNNLLPHIMALGIKDFVPQLTDEGYEEFSALISRANSWLQCHTGISTVSFQSVMVPRLDESSEQAELGNTLFHTLPGVRSDRLVECFRILRVAFTTHATSDDGGPGPATPLTPGLRDFTYESFTPELVPGRDGLVPPHKTLQTMNETFSAVSNYLLNTPGVDVVSVETVLNPVQLADSGDDQIPSIKWLMTLRVFLAERGALSHTNSNAHEDHPGPIFLRAVVHRQFKHRWLVLSITAFIAMTIIVVISVVSAYKI